MIIMKQKYQNWRRKCWLKERNWNYVLSTQENMTLDIVLFSDNLFPSTPPPTSLGTCGCGCHHQMHSLAHMKVNRGFLGFLSRLCGEAAIQKVLVCILSTFLIQTIWALLYLFLDNSLGISNLRWSLLFLFLLQGSCVLVIKEEVLLISSCDLFNPFHYVIILANYIRALNEGLCLCRHVTLSELMSWWLNDR